ncbi:hypothetical protein [Mesorhizobium sp. B2-1-2]|uniref:hypothetical protein n=1 Tax=Mesorhizobium sp. B2-1-2 TaxID=2589973 RepID=UPI001129F775|nr:hypothetical protein [Mesorhizobium sp. B2-1-2]TPN11742.1 hypothetical protein FJ971_10070 [Mesorhizobium sp. B2-1-2]
MATILSSCAGLDRQLQQASVAKGTAQAKVNIPDQPADCRRTEPHAAAVVGDEARSVLKRERKVTDRLNARILRCAADRDNVKTGLEGK